MNFDALAPHYRWMEWVLAGEKLQNCRTLFLAPDAREHRVLIAGEGSGRFLVECRRRRPNAHITCVDASAGMLGQARRQLRRCGLAEAGIRWAQADALEWEAPPGTFDLIVTHFFLDCFTAVQLERVVTRLAEAATADAQWLLADFCIPRAGWKRCRAQVIHWLMYGFFRVFTGIAARHLAEPDPWLRAAGFDLVERERLEWGLLHSDRWERGS